MKEKIEEKIKFGFLDWIVLFGGILILLIMLLSGFYDFLAGDFYQVFIHLIWITFGLYVVYTKWQKFKKQK